MAAGSVVRAKAGLPAEMADRGETVVGAAARVAAEALKAVRAKAAGPEREVTVAAAQASGEVTTVAVVGFAGWAEKAPWVGVHPLTGLAKMAAALREWQVRKVAKADAQLMV